MGCIYLYKNNLNSYGLWFYSHVFICLSVDKWALRGHFYSYVDPVWSLYNIGSCCHVIVQVVFCIAGKRAGPAHSGCGPKWVGPVWPTFFRASF